MGAACGRDFFAYLLKTYGETFIKWVAGQKSKIFITEKVAQSKKMVADKIAQVKTTAKSQLGSQKTQIANMFNEYKGKIPEGLPGKPQELLGFNSIQEKFKSLDQQIDQQLTNKQKQINENLDKVQKSSHEKIEQQQPQIPILNQLSDSQKKELMDRGEKELQSQVKQARDQQMKQYGDSINPTQFFSSIQSVANLDQIKNLSGDTKSKFQTALSALKAGGSIGGLGDKVKNFFG